VWVVVWVDEKRREGGGEEEEGGEVGRVKQAARVKPEGQRGHNDGKRKIEMEVDVMEGVAESGACWFCASLLGRRRNEEGGGRRRNEATFWVSACLLQCTTRTTHSHYTHTRSTTTQAARHHHNDAPLKPSRNLKVSSPSLLP